jgi:hypothetical protein
MLLRVISAVLRVINYTENHRESQIYTDIADYLLLFM